MLAAIAGYLFSPVGKILMIVLVVLSVAGIAFGMLKIHDAGVRRQAQIEYNNAQLKQVIRDQEKFRKAMEEAQELQREVLEKLRKDRESMEEDLKKIQEYLDSPEAEKLDRPASEIIKETIRRLQKEGQK